MSLLNITSSTRSDVCCQFGNKAGLRDEDAARFWGNVAVAGVDDCWLWTGYANGSTGWKYGAFRLNGQEVKAHRLAYRLATGDIPKGRVICHSCDVTRCCNPKHLFLGTPGDNVRDAAKKERLHVPRPNHHRRKLTPEHVAQIKELRKGGATLVSIAIRYGVTKSAISQICGGKRRVYTAPQLNERVKEGAA